MPGFDDRLKRDLERMAEPADPFGAFERVMERKIRRRILRRAQVVGLVLAVLAGTIGGTLALARVFHGRGTITPGSSPSLTLPPPAPRDYPPGCDASQVYADFNGDGSMDLATVAHIDCLIPPPGNRPTNLNKTDFALSVTWSSGGSRDAIPLAACDSACQAFGASDINNDGSSELFLLVDMGASTQFVEALELPAGADVGDSSTVAPPGAPGYAADEPAKFALGGSVTHLDFLMCYEADRGLDHLVTATSATLTNDQKLYDVHETVFAFQTVPSPPFGAFTVITTRDYTAPFDPTGQSVFQPTGTQCLPSGGAAPPDPSASPTTALGSPLPPCGPNDYEFVPGAEGAGGGAVIYVEVHQTDPRACHLVVTVTLRIEDADGRLLAIDGNPGTINMEGDLPDLPGPSWWWHNWCTEHGSLVYRFNGGGKEVTMSVGAGPGPRCDDPQGPSLLSSIPQN